MSHYLTPSILAADFANLQKEVEMLNESSADGIHVDIMDGVFVPNISFGFPVLEAIDKYSKLPLDVHLMIVKPDRYVQRFAEAGAKNLIVHLEACPHLHRTIQNIKEHGMGVGIAINPHTAVNNLQNIIQDIDIVLLMSVNPGFGGQKFIEQTYNKIAITRSLIERTGSTARIGIDGGVDSSNSKKLVDKGADFLVAGSAIFKDKDPKKMINKLKYI